MKSNFWLNYLSRKAGGGGHECIIVATGTGDTKCNCIDRIEASATEGINNQSKHDGSQPSDTHRKKNRREDREKTEGLLPHAPCCVVLRLLTAGVDAASSKSSNTGN